MYTKEHKIRMDMLQFKKNNMLFEILNTLVASGIALVFSSDYVRTDAMGTQLVESQIGIARQNGNDPRWSRILSAFAHTCLRKKIASKHHLKIHVQGRINDGGVSVDEKSEVESSESLISKPESWSVTRIPQ